MSQVARHASRNQMNGAGLVDVAGRLLLLARTFRTTTAATVRYSSPDSATTERVNSSPMKRFCRPCSSGTGRRDETDRPAPDVAAPLKTSATCIPPLSPGSWPEDLDVISVRGKILSNTVLSRQHMTPEIALHLITPDCAIYHQPVGANHTDTGFSMDPFWGFFWPGGQALTRFILDTGNVLRGKSVLDMGCGCGASAIAAMLVGARRVTANDIDPVALQATLLNAESNGINGSQLTVCGDNLISKGTATRCNAQYDVVLIGDLFYDTEIAADLHPWIQGLARAGTEVFIGDPGRHGITETGVLRHMVNRARYKLPDGVCLENNGFSHANVWQFRITSESV